MEHQFSKSYFDNLKSPMSWDELAMHYSPPAKLYKYQSFSENAYWERNLNGEFHLSLAKDFEDKNDCRPSISPETAIKKIHDFLTQIGAKEEQCKAIVQAAESEITEKSINQIADNYQNDIRIGCFTDRSDNHVMWDKYSDSRKGYCIEYRTDNNKLFRTCTLPVCYTNEKVDISDCLSNLIIYSSIEQMAKNNAKIRNKLDACYGVVLKRCYIPVFIKTPDWGFEKEYRMFILKHRTVSGELMKANEIIDEKGNIDLSDSITGIYLGERFEENEDCEMIRSKIKQIAKAHRIPVYQRFVKTKRIY